MPEAGKTEPTAATKQIGRTTQRADLALRIVPWLVAALCLVPILVNLPEFRKLLYFGDDWDQLSQMDALGFARWASRPFAENTVPLYKTLWGGSILAFHGSYLAVLSVEWLTHALSIGLLGGIMRRLGFTISTIAVAMLFFGLPASNIETLAWSVQLSPLLAAFFMLLAWRILVSILDTPDGLPRLKLLLYVLVLIASALSFSRGLLSGIVFALFVLLYRPSPAPARTRRIVLVISLALPFILGCVVNPPRLLARPGVNFAAAFVFGVHYLLLNPFFQIAGFAIVGWGAVCVFGLAKLSVTSMGFADTRKPPQIAFLAALLFLDLMNAVLLGYGRYHTGLPASVSSRYQYVPLLCAAPFIGVVFARLFPSWNSGKMARLAAVSAVLALYALLAWPWNAQISAWSGWRGTAVRAALASAPPEERIAFSLTSVARARELQAKYNLH
ncbi:MAG: hypothetical protein ABSG25_01670 [Bryobacteraceae bacterium]